MTAIFELPLPSETLAADELAEITGALTSRGQAEWLAASMAMQRAYDRQGVAESRQDGRRRGDLCLSGRMAGAAAGN